MRRIEGESYQDYLQSILNCGFCNTLIRKTDPPECCDLAKGLSPDQVVKVSEMGARLGRLYALMADIACIACDEISPTMRRVAAKLPLSEPNACSPKEEP